MCCLHYGEMLEQNPWNLVVPGLSLNSLPGCLWDVGTLRYEANILQTPTLFFFAWVEMLPIRIYLKCRHLILGLYSLNSKTSYHQISSSLDDARLDVWTALKFYTHFGSAGAEVSVNISERLEKSKPESRGFEISRDLAVRRLSLIMVYTLYHPHHMCLHEIKCMYREKMLLHLWWVDTFMVCCYFTKTHGARKCYNSP